MGVLIVVQVDARSCVHQHDDHVDCFDWCMIGCEQKDNVEY